MAPQRRVHRKRLLGCQQGHARSNDKTIEAGLALNAKDLRGPGFYDFPQVPACGVCPGPSVLITPGEVGCMVEEDSIDRILFDLEQHALKTIAQEVAKHPFEPDVGLLERLTAFPILGANGDYSLLAIDRVAEDEVVVY